MKFTIERKQKTPEVQQASADRRMRMIAFARAHRKQLMLGGILLAALYLYEARGAWLIFPAVILVAVTGVTLLLRTELSKRQKVLGVAVISVALVIFSSLYIRHLRLGLSSDHQAGSNPDPTMMAMNRFCHGQFSHVDADPEYTAFGTVQIDRFQSENGATAELSSFVNPRPTSPDTLKCSDGTQYHVYPDGGILDESGRQVAP